MLEKVKVWFKSLWKRFKAWLKELATPVPTQPNASIVELPRPPSGDSVVPTPNGEEARFKALVAQGLDLWTITLRMGRALTDTERAYARFMGVPGSEVVTPGAPAGQNIDRREVRFLSGDQGNMGIAEGPAGAIHYFTVKGLIGETLQIITGKTQSDLGDCDTITVAAEGQHATGSFDAKTLIQFPANGEMQAVMVKLGKAGAVTVQVTKG